MADMTKGEIKALDHGRISTLKWAYYTVCIGNLTKQQIADEILKEIKRIEEGCDECE
jgi:hypothetical protein